MPVPVTIPRLGWNMEEGTFVEWLKADGDAVRPGEMLFRLEGEKSVEEIEAFDGGTLSIPPDAPKPGDRVVVGAVIGYLLQPGEAKPNAAIGPTGPVRPVGPIAEEPAAAGSATAEAEPKATAPAISPRARRLAERHGLDTTHVRGSGRTGRIRERDIRAAVGIASASGLLPLSATRNAIAARMMESRQTTAPVTLTSVVGATNLVNLRNQFKAAGNESTVPSYTDFLLKLTAAALQQHPLLASTWTDDGIRPASSIDVGVAVDADAGLLVPVIRDVPSLGLREVARQSRDLIDRARAGKLATRDMDGGCFTITNLGAFGIDAFTPIINPPQCAILGVGRIERRPAMDGDRVVGREQVTLSLTFDHRIVDGAPAARFLQTLARMVESPAPWVSS
jgi:pyruvate dehydrogenase E2 component (dihydrolipoamide acetyltransferase)